MTKYFRVKVGFGVDDFISIDQSEVRKAMIAQVNGKVAIFKEGTISGNSIISIIPDYNREMGFARDYKLCGEDYKEIGSKRVNESRLILQVTLGQILGKQTLSEIENKEINELSDKFKIN